MPFAYDYLLMVFLGAIGAFQIAAARSNLRGILILPRRPFLSALIGGLFIIVAIRWFFFSGELRNVPDTAGGLDGNVQALLFVIGSSGAFAITLFVSSVLNHRWASKQSKNRQYLYLRTGLEILEHTTFVAAILSRLASRAGEKH